MGRRKSIVSYDTTNQLPRHPTEAEYELARLCGFGPDFPKRLRQYQPRARSEFQLLRDRVKHRRSRGDWSVEQEQHDLAHGRLARNLRIARAQRKLLWWARAVELFVNRAAAEARARQLGLYTNVSDAVWARACVRETARGKPILHKTKRPRKNMGEKDSVRPWSREKPLVPHVDWEATLNGGDDFDWMIAGGRALRRPPGTASSSKPKAVLKKILDEDRQLREQSYLRCVGRRGAKEIGWFRSPPAEGFRVCSGYALEPIGQKVKDAWEEFKTTWEASISTTPLGEERTQAATSTSTEQKEKTNDADQITERQMGDHDGSCLPVPSQPRQFETVA